MAYRDHGAGVYLGPTLAGKLCWVVLPLAARRRVYEQVNLPALRCPMKRIVLGHIGMRKFMLSKILKAYVANYEMQ